jgi:hypothetical protein
MSSEELAVDRPVQSLLVSAPALAGYKAHLVGGQPTLAPPDLQEAAGVVPEGDGGPDGFLLTVAARPPSPVGPVTETAGCPLVCCDAPTLRDLPAWRLESKVPSLPPSNRLPAALSSAP